MKNWLTIGQFAKIVGVSPKALRLYEAIGLIRSHVRGENGYRYYDEKQVMTAIRLKEFKDLGFKLKEIKGLLNLDTTIESRHMAIAMKSRLQLISKQSSQLHSQKKQIEEILTSLENNKKPLKADQRRAIMSFYGNAFILVTGNDGLDKTANLIQLHFKNDKKDIPIFHWNEDFNWQREKPFILILQESNLNSKNITNLHPDVIVIKNLGFHSIETQNNYLKLYSKVGPHVTTVLNADDRSSVDLAANSLIRKGRIFYFSKNKSLEDQIQKIGGVISDGDQIDIYGFNLKPDAINIRIKQIMTHQDEVALLSSIGAVMTLGLESVKLSRQ